MYDFIDDSFSRKNSHEYILSIQVSLNGFSFCIRELSGRILCFKHIDLKISSEQFISRRFADWCNEEELLQLTYNQKQLVYIGKRFTLLPQQMESEELKGDLRELLLQTGDEEEYAENWIKEVQAKLIFVLPPEFNGTVKEKLGEVRICHIVQKLIHWQDVQADKSGLLLFFDHKDLYLVLKQKKQLTLANAYKVNHANDVIYYALSVAKQLKVDLKSCKVTTGGQSTLRNSLNEQLQQHFGTVEILAAGTTNSEKGETTMNDIICLI